MYPNILRAIMPAFTVAVLKNVKINCDESQRKYESSQARVSVLNKIIDFDQFKKEHPGGRMVLDPRLKGYDLTQFMLAHVPFHFQHGVILALLKKHEVGDGALPLLPKKIESEMARNLHGATAAPDEIDHGGGNKEPKLIGGDYQAFFDADGTTPRYFKRTHGPEQGNPNDVIIKAVDGKVSIINRVAMTNRPGQVDITMPIICAGASRSMPIQAGEKVNGIAWGKQEVTTDGQITQGADAIGNVSFRVLPLYILVAPINHQRQRLYDLLSYVGLADLMEDTNLVYILEGSDGYKAAIHSRELNDAWWDPSKNRALVDGPGFRQIKKLKKITIQRELSEEKLSSVLENRLGSPMGMLEGYVRQILAVCPEYDAYVLREEAGKPPFGFNHKMPPCIKVWQHEQENGEIKIKALVYGTLSASHIRAIIKKKSGALTEQQFDIQFFPNSKRIGMVDVSFPDDDIEKITLKANTNSKEHYFIGGNRRGLYYTAMPQTIVSNDCDLGAKDSKRPSMQP